MFSLASIRGHHRRDARLRVDLVHWPEAHGVDDQGITCTPTNIRTHRAMASSRVGLGVSQQAVAENIPGVQ